MSEDFDGSVGAVEPAGEGADHVDGVAPKLFDRRTLAAHLMVSIRTLDRLDADGQLPPAVWVGGSKRWTRASIYDWLRLGCPRREAAASIVGRK